MFDPPGAHQLPKRGGLPAPGVFCSRKFKVCKPGEKTPPFIASIGGGTLQRTMGEKHPRPMETDDTLKISSEGAQGDRRATQP